MKFDTKVVHAGITPDPTTGSIVPPIYATATYVLDEVGKDKGFDYTRSANPTRQVLEANLAAIGITVEIIPPATQPLKKHTIPPRVYNPRSPEI